VRVLFDHQTFSIQRYGGISRYFVNLNNGLNKVPGVHSEIAALYTENEYLKSTPVPLNNAWGKKLFSGHFNRIYRWNSRYCNFKIRRNNFNVFHPTYYDPYFIAGLKKPFVLTVHDMIHELMPNQFADNDKVVAQKKLLINRADAIIAISEYTKGDIIKFYPQVEDKITVIHHGYSFETHSSVEGGHNGKYILFVGERPFYKNFSNFLKALAPLLSADKDLKLICTGGGAFSADELQLVASLNITGQCHQVNVTDGELQQLYTDALVFVFPSFIEGFGLPLLEAFNAGCPVAASNTSCFPEIGGNAIAYFDPHHVESIRETITTLLTDSDKRSGYITRGRERLKLFSIEKQVQQTLDVYRNLNNV
jgi:glycosyltransferase involved in cell wall biosynthesis